LVPAVQHGHQVSESVGIGIEALAVAYGVARGAARTAGEKIGALTVGGALYTFVAAVRVDAILTGSVTIGEPAGTVFRGRVSCICVGELQIIKSRDLCTTHEKKKQWYAISEFHR
jgi:hypothetical protein